MANPKVQIDVTLNDKATDGLKGLSSSLKQMGRDISIVSRELITVSAAVTGTMTVAFSKAAKDIPAVANEIKSLSNSFQSMADSVSTAALPSLQQFSNFMNNVAITIRDFSESHQELINKVVKTSAVVLALSTAGYALGGVFKALAASVRLLTPLMEGLNLVLGITKIQSAMLTQSVVALVDAYVLLTKLNPLANLKNFALGGIFGFSAGGNAQLIQKEVDKIKAMLDSLFNDTNSPVQRSVDNWGRFSRGFQSSLKSMADNVEEFGKSVSDSIQKAFSDTIFDAITGKLHGLRDVIKSLGETILKAGLNNLVNAGMGKLFGTAEKPNSGLFGGALNGLFEILGLKKTSKQFEDLTQNMKYFGKEKDKVIDKLKVFGKGLDKESPAKGAGSGIGGIAEGISVNIGSFMDAAKATGGLNAMLAGTLGLVSALGTGFDAVGLKIIKMGITYAVTQVAMLAVSMAAAVTQVAIGTATAAALAAAWVVPALLASIATLGGAAAIGAGALAGAMAATGGMVAAGFSASTAGGAGGLPAGAGISFGDGEFPKGAEGGIVTRPTLALIGEAGPEAVVPLNRTPGSSPLGKGRGGSNVNINIDTAMLNSPSNMMDFVRLLKQELAR